MPALSAARRSSVSVKGMSRTILSECASCNKKGYYSSQVRVNVVDGQELYQCEPCEIEKECGGKQISPTAWRKV
eukprot:11633964-Karenia_brevis.AAC.1